MNKPPAEDVVVLAGMFLAVATFIAVIYVAVATCDPLKSGQIIFQGPAFDDFRVCRRDEQTRLHCATVGDLFRGKG